LESFLLKPSQKVKHVDHLMPMIGARFYTQLDSTYLWGDMIEGELEKEIENGRLFRLMCKLGSVNERPHLSGSVGSNHDQSWAESGDRFLIRMFRTYLFRQVHDGQSWLELSHICGALNKLDVGSEEKLMLHSQDEQNVILVTYKDLKKALNKCFTDLYRNNKDQRHLQLPNC
jgi:PAB-dependent poly(A)-specific ribonuclease subunit 3